MDLDRKTAILSDLVQKLWSKTSFCIMVANILLRSHTSLVQIAQDIFPFTERPRQGARAGDCNDPGEGGQERG